MVESISATSLLGYRPLCGGYDLRSISSKKAVSVVCFPLSGLGANWSSAPSIEAQAMELTKETYLNREQAQIPRDFELQVDMGADRKPGLWPPENKADNPKLHNPLLRQERMGCGWLGAIFEWEGVLIEDNPNLEKQAWVALAQEEGKCPPPAFTLRRIEGMKNEQAISEVLCWSRDPAQVRRMAFLKEEIYQNLQGGMYSFRTGSQEFVNLLMHYKIPMALVSTRPRKFLETAITSIGIEGVFNVIVAAEDVHRGKPDPEMFAYAAQSLNFIPERCIVFGNSNQTVEAARDARMKCVAVASKHPALNLERLTWW
ncbi:Sugar-terminal-phosphatase [Bertholletia excelsa]